MFTSQVIEVPDALSSVRLWRCY